MLGEMKAVTQSPKVSLHFTNVTGTGAVQLLESLLPAMENSQEVSICTMYLPNQGPLSSYRPKNQVIDCTNYKRALPNSISRVLECLFFSMTVNPAIPILVFGDIPLRCKAPQVVFVQTSHLLSPKKIQLSFDFIKFLFARFLFSFTSRYVNVFIVQTSLMKELLAVNYPAIANKIVVIPQPAPQWLLRAVPNKNQNTYLNGGLKLIYPAAGYRHKNHRLLSKVNLNNDLQWPLESLKITLDPDKNPNPNVAWLQCVGLLSGEQMVQAYSEVDALVFLSTDESYGLPLVEAMFLNLPIICPDLAYSRTLCGPEAIYFDPSSVESLNVAVIALHERLNNGWKPDWSDQLQKMPQTWSEVADQMIRVILKSCYSRDELHRK